MNKILLLYTNTNINTTKNTNKQTTKYTNCSTCINTK